jgi:hypothetical protein
METSFYPSKFFAASQKASGSVSAPIIPHDRPHDKRAFAPDFEKNRKS